MFRLDGRIALITGAATGLGAATAVALASQGASVVVSDKPGESLERTLDEAAQHGGRVLATPLDVRDNDHIHLLFVRRSDGSLACREPLFGEGRSGTDISAVAFESDDGRHVAVVENNWGYHSFPVAALEPGITRVDAERQTDGSYRCRTIWESREGNLGVMKASLGNGLLYTYFRRDDAAVDQFGFSTIDLRDGRTVSRVHAGSGQGFNNWSGALFLSPRGVVYTTTIFGLVEWRDEHPGRTDAPPG